MEQRSLLEAPDLSTAQTDTVSLFISARRTHSQKFKSFFIWLSSVNLELKNSAWYVLGGGRPVRLWHTGSCVCYPGTEMGDKEGQMLIAPHSCHRDVWGHLQHC